MLFTSKMKPASLVTSLLLCMGTYLAVAAAARPEAAVPVLAAAAAQPTTTATRPAGLIAHYPLAGDAREVSGNGRDGRAVGTAAAEDRHGRKGGALAFDGIESEIVLDPPPALSAKGFTVAVWAKFNLPARAKPWVDVTDGNGKFRDPIVGQDDGFTIRTFQLWLNPDRQVVWHRLGEYSSAWTQKTAVEAGQWYHLAATFDGTFHRMFLNGREEHKVEGIFKVCCCEPIYVGSKGTGTFKRAFFSGAMSDLRFYDRALSAEEIAALHGAKP